MNVSTGEWTGTQANKGIASSGVSLFDEGLLLEMLNLIVVSLTSGLHKYRPPVVPIHTISGNFILQGGAESFQDKRRFFFKALQTHHDKNKLMSSRNADVEINRSNVLESVSCCLNLDLIVPNQKKLDITGELYCFRKHRL